MKYLKIMGLCLVAVALSGVMAARPRLQGNWN